MVWFLKPLKQKIIMEKQPLIIDIKDCVASSVNALNNRSWGIAVRSASGIDIKEEVYGHITIKISRQISSINAVFLEEFLENVVHKLGSFEEFKKRFHFEAEGQYTQEKIDYYVEEAVKNLLKLEIHIDD
jgi:hypothetical protein